MTRHHRWLIPLSFLTLSASVQAQDYTGDLGVTFTDIGIQTAMMDAAMDTVTESGEADASEPAARAQEAISARFAAQPSRTKANLAHFVRQARSQSPAAAAQIERLFSQVDVIGEAGAAMRAVGLDPHNVADAYAVWWVQAWGNANMREAPSDAGTFRAVSRQARDAFAGTQSFAALSDAAKQQYAEALMVQAVLLGSAYDGAAGNADLKHRLAKHAKEGAKGEGLDLTAMTLTPEGFRPRKGAALDPVTTSETGGDLTTYAAIAAAAGAGLGAAYWLGRSGRSG